MAGRGRIPERGGAIRQRQLETVGDPLGEGSSRDAEESHTAPLTGLPATEAGVVYSRLGVIQRKGGKNQGSLYNHMMVRIQEEAKRTVDEDGEEGFSFDLSEFFPRVRTVGIEMKIMTKDFNPCRFGGSFKTNWNAPETASQYLEIHWNNFVNQNE